MFIKITNIARRFPTASYVFYITVSIIVIDSIMAALFSDKLATHSKYYTVDNRCKNDFFHHSLRKNVDTTTEFLGTKYHMYTNSIGLIDSSNRKVELNTDKKRVVFIGDSFTEGLGLTYDNTFVGIISKTLARDNTDVLNAAVVSYSPKLYYLKTRYLLQNIKLRFDTLVVFIDHSDIRDEILYKNYIPTDKETENGIKYYAKVYAIKHSVILNLADRLIRKIWPETLDDVKQTELKMMSLYRDLNDYKYSISGWYTDNNYALWGAEGASLAAMYMSELVSLCRNYGIEVIIAVYPWPRQVDENIAENYHVHYWKTFAKENGLPFINFYPLFMGQNANKIIDSYYIKDDNHFNVAGNRLIATEFLRWYRLNR